MEKHECIKLVSLLKELQSMNGCFPTNRELGIVLNCSHEQARLMLVELEEKRYIERWPNKSRAIKILEVK